MQDRHCNRERYFKELAKTSEKHFIPYIEKHKAIKRNNRILEVGCGEGGNLLPFVDRGCSVHGIDLCEARIEQAKLFFSTSQKGGSFTCADFLDVPPPSSEEERYDVILVHDVIEHIAPLRKADFLLHIKKFTKKDGVIFVAFPAWQMPFGGHQQICKSKVCATLPFMHLLPYSWYKKYLAFFKEKEGCITELLEIKCSKMTIEHFEEICYENNFKITNRTLWFINPHYQEKFNLLPLRLKLGVDHLPFFRNFFATSCFYILQL